MHDLKSIAKSCRLTALRMIYEGQAGHPGGSLSIIDILVALYFSIMHVDPNKPHWPDRDRLILSKGHVSAGLYSVLSHRGYFKKEVLKQYGKVNGILQCHPDMSKCPGVDFSTGSLGQGLSVGVGIALGARLLSKTFRTFVVLGDGELQEGQVWEALMLAAEHNLNNITLIIDFNGLQQTRVLNKYFRAEKIKKRIESFGWNVELMDGHSFDEISDSMGTHKTQVGPQCLIAKTTKGKGLSLSEGKLEWHMRQISDLEMHQIESELSS